MNTEEQALQLSDLKEVCSDQKDGGDKNNDSGVMSLISDQISSGIDEESTEPNKNVRETSVASGASSRIIGIKGLPMN
jgi:hypothetical protein